MILHLLASRVASGAKGSVNGFHKQELSAVQLFYCYSYVHLFTVGYFSVATAYLNMMG